MEFLTECNKCGKCKETCPSYQIFLNESFCPRGRVRLIKAFEEKALSSNESLKRRIFSCLLCGTCETSCPLNVNVTSLVYNSRAKMKKGFLQYLFKYFSLYPSVFLSILPALIGLTNLLNLKNLPLLSRFSTLNIKDKPSNSLRVYSKVKPVGRVAIFSGCSANYLLPSITNSLIHVLNWLNYEVIVPKQQCCGAPLLGAGFKKEAIRLAEKNLEIYKSFNIDGVITPCPTCAHFIGDVYKEIAGESIPVLKFADLFESIDEFIKEPSENQVFFHISCHTFNYVKDADKTAELLQKFGYSVQKKTGCCGFGGLFSFLFEKQSMDILRKKVLEYEKADMIISSCPNCIIQFKLAMKDKKILHYAEAIHKILLKGEKNGKGFF